MRRWQAETQQNIDRNLPSGFSWVEENRLAGSSVPESRDHLEALVKEGVVHLVSLSPEDPPPCKRVDGLRITFIPVEDFEAPNTKHFQRFFKLCERAHARDQAVAVHCRGGNGRTGTMSSSNRLGIDALAASGNRRIRFVRLCDNRPSAAAPVCCFYLYYHTSCVRSC